MRNDRQYSAERRTAFFGLIEAQYALMNTRDQSNAKKFGDFGQWN